MKQIKIITILIGFMLVGYTAVKYAHSGQSSKPINTQNINQNMSGGGPGFSLKIDSSRITGPFENTSGGINFSGNSHEKNRFFNEVLNIAINSGKQQSQGKNVIRLKVPVYLWPAPRPDGTWQPGLLKNIPQDIIDGVRAATAAGAEVLFQFYGVPLWLSASQDTDTVSNHLPNFSKYPPTDFDKLSDLYEFIASEIKALGIDASYYELYGEPNVPATYIKPMMPCIVDGKLTRECEPNDLDYDLNEVIQSFCEVYRYAAQGIRRCDPLTPIGGSGDLLRWDSLYLIRLLAYSAQQNNVPLDFVSFHGYKAFEDIAVLLEDNKKIEKATGGFTRQVIEKLYGRLLPTYGDRDHVGDLLNYHLALRDENGTLASSPFEFWYGRIRNILDAEGFSDTVLGITESNSHWEPDELRSTTHYGSAFFIAAFKDVSDSPFQFFLPFTLGSRVPLQNGGRREATFFLFETDSTPRPSYNALRLLAGLVSGDRLLIETDDQQENEFYSLASSNSDAITAVITHYKPAEEPDYDGERVTLDFSITNIPFKEYTYSVRYIGKNYSNNYFGPGAELEEIDSGTGTGDFEKTYLCDCYGSFGVTITKKEILSSKAGE
jgi:hypothetical protein